MKRAFLIAVPALALVAAWALQVHPASAQGDPSAEDDPCPPPKIKTNVREITKISDTEIELDLDTTRKALTLMERLEDHDDVQNVYADFSPSDEALAELGDE